MKRLILKSLYHLSPFNLKGDLAEASKKITKAISCLIATKGNHDQVVNILGDLANQTLGKEKFEVIVVDNSGKDETKTLCDRYKNILNIQHVPEATSIKELGYLRNLSAQNAQGNIFLFLDDDTRLLQEDFLEVTLNLMGNPQTGVVLPLAKSLYGIVHYQYDFLDPHSFATRCLIVKRTLFEEIGGFYNFLHGGYEDIEIGIRYSLTNYKILKTNVLCYYHPPLYFASMEKPFCLGQDVWAMKSRYSFLIWLLVYLHAMRFLIYFIFPTKTNIQWGKISLGVLCAPFLRRRYIY